MASIRLLLTAGVAAQFATIRQAVPDRSDSHDESVDSGLPERGVELETVVRDLAPRVLRYCLGRSGQREMAEDAAQDALSALVDRWRSHGPPDQIEAFVFTVARRRLARRQWRRRLLEPIDELLGRPSPSLDPESRAATHGELERALRGLDRLRPKLKEALLLVVAGEMSTQEAARVLGISPSALKMRVARARQQLADHTAE